MKKALFLSFFFTSSAVIGFAQNKQAAPAQTVSDAGVNEATLKSGAATETAKLDKIVSLSDAQKQKVHEFNMSVEKRKQMVAKADAPSQKRILDDIERTRAQVYMQMLTPEQAKKYNEYLTKNK